MFEWLKCFNDNYANAVSALTPFVIGVVSWFYYSIYKEAQTRGVGAIYISPVFWSLRDRHRIDTVKRFQLTADKKNYEELETLYTPQSWGQHIKSVRNGFRTEIIPNDSAAILAVTIKRKPYENWKIIYFNR